MIDIEIRLLRLIPVGSDRPINTNELAKILGLDVRRTREIISRLITKYGVPIVGTSKNPSFSSNLITQTLINQHLDFQKFSF
ncbi:hypothetical protein [Streptococcus danieliae]|uniref:hypothetical protein n=1 Tax=Streptococcus danieliae TaxID=747656 RepID=UPI0026EABC8C|nr:hypothetical protein [Streptococcus danieliae]